LDCDSALNLNLEADNPGKIHFASALQSGEVRVQDVALQSGWESFLLAAPLVGMALVGIFRLDAIAAAPKCERSRRRPPSGIDENGRMILSDPDGRLWGDPRGPSD